MTANLTEMLSVLRDFYGPLVFAGPTGWFEIILWENVAYLVPDDRRELAWQSLKAIVGTGPADILSADRDTLVQAIGEGGMLAPHRAEKLKKCAEIAIDRFGNDLGAMLRLPTIQMRRELMRFPGIGAPGADKLLLLTKVTPVLALESNGLRVLLRLGYGEETRNYGRTYRSAQAAASKEIETDFGPMTEAFRLLLHHGHEICKCSRRLHFPAADPRR